MVRLTMTPSVVKALGQLDSTPDTPQDAADTAAKIEAPAEPSLEDPQVGNPITHSQIVDVWKRSKETGLEEFSLEKLLQGSQVYIPPPPPKPEPSPQYKALMAQLRRDEEERKYQRMLKQPTRMETFSQQFPSAMSTTQAYAEVNRPTKKSDEGDDEVSYADVHRQMMLLLNFLVSIFGVAATIWVVARWWSTPARLLVTMGGAIVVGIAEVAVYNGYMWRMGEAKSKQAKEKEVKEVVQTWVVGKDGEEKTTDASEEKVVLLDTKAAETDEGIRRRLQATAAPT